MDNQGTKFARLNRRILRNQKWVKYSSNEIENIDPTYDGVNVVEQHERVSSPLHDITNGTVPPVPQLRNKRCFLSDDVNEQRKQKNVSSSNISIDRTIFLGTLQKNSNNLGLISGIRIFGMHVADRDKINEQFVVPVSLYENCTPPISVPMMRLGKVSSSQPLTHYSKSLPLRDLNNGAQSQDHLPDLNCAPCDEGQEDEDDCEVIYTVEFHKRGLPHAHILLFHHEQNKHPTPVDIDRIISAEISNEFLDPHYYKAVQLFMIHGPCGPTRNYSPCMQDGRCTKNFPKKSVGTTTIDEDCYPIYRKREDGRTIKKYGIDPNNRYGVPLCRWYY
ncbi:hypothetical protein CQW23_16423 [Capsicum baccatum]|uniref:Helitron helicase-like domain-containing protein n=1 Tax=Capsicum baccatum TaxID=33114 RepID=A0A2G2WAW3_CAPBA|nr:hypothetical protein CQW23_16423 [Capsicum baccatum]